MMSSENGWQFWIDRGGTFTDVVARDPDGKTHIHKLLSDNPEQYADAPLHAVRTLMGLGADEPIPSERIQAVKMGTTLATNALLERKGVPVGLVVTKGFADLLEIGYQDRPDLFALEIVKPTSLAAAVVEIDERVLADGTVRTAPNPEQVRGRLSALREQGIDSVAVLFLHSFAYPEHELLVGKIAAELGFSQVSLSHQVANEIKAVPRGDTTMVDAYLTPIIRDYVANARRELGEDVPLHFMQSNGGLANAERFSGKDAILSGPAGGVIAYQHVGRQAGFDKCIGFDMGGTSTDVSRVDVMPEHVYEKVVAGVRLKAPMIRIETVAAGGGSILQFDGRRLTVGPESAGAYPGPACYRRGGPATVTDANLVLGRIQPAYFPKCFGPNADQPLDPEASRAKLAEIAGRVTEATGKPHTLEEVAAGFIRIANANMAKPIKEISVARGYDVQEYALACFGGAGPQHACAIAAELGMSDVFIHPYAGVLSAYGMGLADISHTGVETVLRPLDEMTFKELELRFAELEAKAEAVLTEEGIPQERMSHNRSVGLRYQGTDDVLEVHPDIWIPKEEWDAFQAAMDECCAAMEELERTKNHYWRRPAKGKRGSESLSESLDGSLGFPMLPAAPSGRHLKGPGDYRQAFEEKHRLTYGFVKEGHPIEVVNIRLQSSGKAENVPSCCPDAQPEPVESHEFVARLMEQLADMEHENGGNGSSAPEPRKASKRLEERFDEYLLRQDTEGVWVTGGPEPISPDAAVDRVLVCFDILSPDGTRAIATTATPVFRRSDFKPFNYGEGPAVIVEEASTIVVDPGWSFGVDNLGNLFFSAEEHEAGQEKVGEECDPVMLEVFNNLFMSVADQMGETLERVSHSVNIKERRDFSCAIFTPDGELVANAHHIPVHLGAMSETVRAVIDACGAKMKPGDVFVTNDPYCGGSHLPDVTVVTPVFGERSRPLFFVASRGHHADIGGKTPGSMPPFSKTLDEEGVVIRNLLLVSEGSFREKEIVELLQSGPFPARNIEERLSDLRAQIAANAQGVRLLEELCQKYSVCTVTCYMGYVRDNAAAAMREVIAELPDGEHHFEDQLDCGARIACTVTVEGDQAVVDFAGTDPQLDSNLNAPPAVTKAAVLYTFRTLVGRPIPLNGGCLDPIEIRIPEGCLLNPRSPAAVAGGNVETSMRVVDVIYGALGVLAAGQGTMNNFSFGGEDWGYYETICGGAGAGKGFVGASAVHTHMTNTRITDPEVLEHRYPVVLREFAIRRGSGGTGQWLGGDGVVRSVEFREAMSATMLSERRDTVPFGIHGGEAGQPGRNTLIRGGEESLLPGHFAIYVQSGDVIRVETPGGGGCGAEREQ